MKTCSICGKATHVYTHPWGEQTPLCLSCNEIAHQSPLDGCTSTIEVALAHETHLIECPSGESRDLIDALRLDGVDKFIVGYRDDTFQYDTWVVWWDGLRRHHEVLDQGFSIEVHLVPPGTLETWA